MDPNKKIKLELSLAVRVDAVTARVLTEPVLTEPISPGVFERMRIAACKTIG